MMLRSPSRAFREPGRDSEHFGKYFFLPNTTSSSPWHCAGAYRPNGNGLQSGLTDTS
jgi:hypothetical protein